MRPYGLMADLHFHNWQSFSSVLEPGINSRLVALHREVIRCCKEVKLAGGNRIYIAGDVFHVRGSIAPSVLNPTLDTMRALIGAGFEFFILPGNHDLEGKHSTRIGSAITALEGIGCKVCDECQVIDHGDSKVLMFPWFESLRELKEELIKVAGSGEYKNADVLLHAPIDGTLAGIPAHGLSPEFLADLGFGRVFAGHYHHHKDFGRGVYSIGALSHHTWSDVGSKAGFLIVGADEVKWFKAHTPEFVDLSAASDETEAEIMAEGNFVRARITKGDMKSVNAMKEWLEKAGARAVIVQVIKEPTKAREGAVVHSVRAGASVEASIAEFIKGSGLDNAEAVQIECQKILAETVAEV